MQPNLTIDKFYVRPPVKYEENIKELSFYRRAEAPVQAELTDWDISDLSLIHISEPTRPERIGDSLGGG